MAIREVSLLDVQVAPGLPRGGKTHRRQPHLLHPFAGSRPPLKDNKECHVEHSIDIARNHWRILLNGEQVFDGPLQGKSLRKIRFSMGFRGDEDNADVERIAATISNLAIHPDQLGPDRR